MIDYAKVVDFSIDMAPFIIYLALLGKIHMGWKKVKQSADEERKHRLASLMLLVTLVIALFLASNVYALVVYGRTYLSLRFFQMFIVGNCLAYWLVIDFLTKESVPAEGRLRESTE